MSTPHRGILRARPPGRAFSCNPLRGERGRAMFLPLLLALLLAGCETTRVAVNVAQVALEPYSFYVKGTAEGVLGVNARYLAVDAKVDVVIQYRAPENDVLGAPPVVRWEKTFQRGEGKRAYEVVFGADGKFVQVKPATWAAARLSMPWLPAPG
jgi:hypothetical protein